METQTAQSTQPAQVQNQQGSRSKKPLIVVVTLLLVIAFASAAYFLFFQSAVSNKPREQVVTGLDRESVVIADRLAYSGVFPNSTQDFAEVVFNNNIFDGLGRIINGQVKPALAKSWTNPDKTTWRLSLRKGVKFHNGDSFTASDVKFSIDEALKNDWPNSFNLSTVKSVTVVDDFTVDIKTASPDPVLLNRLVFAFIVSEKQFKDRGENPAVGTGPYKYVSLTKDRAVLEANQDYYLGVPKVNKIIYKFFPEDTTDKELVESLQKGEFDLVKLGDAKLANGLKAQYQVESLADPFITFFWPDNSRDKSPYIDKSPNPLKNKLVRQAVYKAIDVNELIKEASLSAVPASQFVTDAIFGYNPNIARPLPNVSEAKKLMDQAGFGDGFGLTVDVFTGREKEAKALSKQLGKINIKVKIRTSGDEFFDRLFSADLSSFIIDYGAETFDSGEIFTNVLHTPNNQFGGDNFTSYSNSDLDQMSEEVASIFDPKARSAKLQEVMSKAMEDLPLIPLYSKEFFYVFKNNIDWTPTAFGAIYGNEISGRQIIVE